MDLYKKFKGKNINIEVNKKIPHFSEVSNILNNYKIPYESYSSILDESLQRLDISFGCETDFQDLYILTTLLKNFGLQTLFYSGMINNDVTVGAYINKYRGGQEEPKEISTEAMLSLPYTTSINDFLKTHFGVNANDMDSGLSNWLSATYDILTPNDCTSEEAERVVEISCTRKGITSLKGLDRFKKIVKMNLSDNEIADFDLTPFQNLRELDCSYCPIKRLIISKNPLLEYIRYAGLRGRKLAEINTTGNPKLKKFIGGQDGFSQIDFSNNPSIEEININLSQDLRYLNLQSCSELKRIVLRGVLIPFVDLTKNNKLEHVEINYLNTFKGREDEYGKGYPRPFIFVNENFSANVINMRDREYEYYTYVLIVVKKNSKEEKVLQKLNEMRQTILEISNVASFHYEITK